MIKSGIYKITNLKNKKIYIGSSKDIELRWKDHKKHLNGGYHVNKKLQNAWNFYGEKEFEFTVLEENIKIDKLLDREQFYLDKFKPYLRDIGYNIGLKSSGGDNFTNNPNKNNIRKKMVIINSTGHMFGRKHSNKSKQIQKNKAIGRFTLKWFIEKYGKCEGELKYRSRNKKLSNRNINYTYDNKLTGKKRGPMSESMKKRISEQKQKFALRKNEFIEDLKSNNYTIVELSKKYDISTTSVKLYKRKIYSKN